MFDWSAATWKDVICSRFWLYWVITIPLSFISVGLWRAFSHFDGLKNEQESQDNHGSKKADPSDPIQKERVDVRDTERIDNQLASMHPSEAEITNEMRSPPGSIRVSENTGTGEMIDPKSASKVGSRDMEANGSNPEPTGARESLKSGSFLHFAQSLMRRHHSDRKKDEEI